MVLVGTSALAGSRYGDLNQDAVFTAVLHSEADLRRLGGAPQAHVALVLDGHGMLGEAAAHDAGAAMMRHLQRSALRGAALADLPRAEVEALLAAAFAAGHEAALRRYDAAPATYVYPRGADTERRYTLRREPDGTRAYHPPEGGGRLFEFGATCTAVVVQGRVAAVAHVGDSLAVLGSCAAGDAYRGAELTRAHNTLDPGEAARVRRACGGGACLEGARARAGPAPPVPPC
jgi:hypothetical protein